MGMIDAKQAKEILGCDDARLQQLINDGQVRAQRQGGKLVVDEDDVRRLAQPASSAKKEEEEEATIVLTGDSDHLQIDLGQIADEAAETIIQPGSAPKDTQQITFGEELEVVNLEDEKAKAPPPAATSTAAMGSRTAAASKPAAARSASFTDTNTAVVSPMDDSAVGATTAPLAVDEGTEAVGSAPLPVADSERRSVRSSRRFHEIEEEVQWYWVAALALAFVIAALFIAPYYIVATVARPGERDYGGNVLRGADDTIWSSMASGIAGFHVEPDQKKWQAAGNTGEYRDIKAKDPQAVWRYQQYLAGMAPEERLGSFVAKSVREEGGQLRVTAEKGAREYTVVEKEVTANDGSRFRTLEAQVWAER
ncbi:MAG: hypothetical protein RMM29_01540 [Planctomycetota bacterium]|nr:hypothetical protein [Planctomycetota bacterium]MDW8372320.1 hypothetical protein [Planctomycetota bacterium]